VGVQQPDQLPIHRVGIRACGDAPIWRSTVQRDGWYPIIIEYAVDANREHRAPVRAGKQPGRVYRPWRQPRSLRVRKSSLVPATSLSPLGCVDQRYQGIAHFDLVQQTLQAVGYQAAVEPQQLESASSPACWHHASGRATTTDLVLKPDAGPRQDGEGSLNYSSTLDSSDFASSLQGNGAGFQSGTTGQLQGHVYDPDTMLASLFDAQGLAGLLRRLIRVAIAGAAQQPRSACSSNRGSCSRPTRTAGPARRSPGRFRAHSRRCGGALATGYKFRRA